MKLSVKPQNPLEWLALKANLVPIPIAHTQILFVLSRAVLCAFKFDIFEQFKQSSLTLNELVLKTNLSKRAMRSVMNVLASAGYFSYASEKFSLTRMSRKWCLKDSPDSTYALQQFNLICWDWMKHMDEFLQTGKGLQYHETLNSHEWELYQKGMESVATSQAKAAVKMFPKFNNPQRMLDIGGSHGIYSVELCRKYPTLHSVILDLPEAVEKAKPILAKYKMGDKVKHRVGNALTDELGENEFDLILVSNLIHHFTSEQCHLLLKKISSALKPGGYCVIQEFLRPEISNNMEMTGALLDLFFNLSSTAGNWSLDEIKNFQTSAGLKFIRVKKFISPPGYVQVIAQKK